MTMVGQLAVDAGLASDSLYFNIAGRQRLVGEHPAGDPRRGPRRRDQGAAADLRPGFGAGAVAGYSVMRIDPAVVALGPDSAAEADEVPLSGPHRPEPSPDDVQLAFG